MDTATHRPLALRHPSWQVVAAAARAQARPALVLWCALALFMLAYGLSETVQSGLLAWGRFKLGVGWPFAFFSHIVFAVLLPEVLDRAVLRKPGSRPADLLYSMLIFGSVGVLVSQFYVWQAHWFGADAQASTVIRKTAVDQLLFGPVLQLVILLLFRWRDLAFGPGLWATLQSPDFWQQRYLPVLIAMWCIWIPGVALVYLMPIALQFPVVSLILSFWMLIHRFIRQA